MSQQKFYRKATVQVAIATAIGLIIAVLISESLPIVFKIPELKSQIAELKQKNLEKNLEIQRLETLLTPFKTIALERYTGTDAEVLSKLALRLHDVESFLTIIQDYSDVAQLDIQGFPGIRAGNGLIMTTPISKLLEGAIIVNKNKIEFNCKETHIQQYLLTIEQFPKFPFPFYVVALCYKRQGRDDWEKYAQKAILIFEKTIRIGGHHVNHDEALNQLLLLLKE